MITQDLKLQKNDPSTPSSFEPISIEGGELEMKHQHLDDETSRSKAEHSAKRSNAFVSRAVPDATYRLQFHAGFTFQQARALIPYLSALGITHVYASPYLKAVPGSLHGYNIVDQSTLNPEIGTEQDYSDFVSELHAHGLGQIVDVVPNHMGVHTNDNAWWSDVLEYGPSSPFASFFDIDWMPLKPDLANKVLLPVLGDQFGRVLEDGQLVLHFEDGTFFVQYYDRRFPIALRSSMILLKHRQDQLEHQLSNAPGENSPSENGTAINSLTATSDTKSNELMEYKSILTAISHLPLTTETDPEKIGEGRREQEVIKRRLRELCQSAPAIQEFLKENVNLFNGTRGDPSSFDLLDQLLLDQSYRLAYWRVAADEVNYRRFFDVNELAAICVENPEVFEKTHKLILHLVKTRQVDGLRIDHPDGLYDPAGYLEALRRVEHEYENSMNLDPTQHLSESICERNDPDTQGVRTVDDRKSDPPIYLVVEKILGRGEHIPEEWPIDGTTGYDFLNAVNGIFVDRNSAHAFDRLYSKFIREPVNFREMVYQCKKQVMDVSMSSEISVLGHQLDAISAQDRTSRDFTLNSLRDTLCEIIACFPVYRTYIGQTGVSDQDSQYVEQAVARAKRRNPVISASIFDFIRDVLLLRLPSNAKNSVRHEWLKFVGKFQQVTGPVMAKAAEDTAYYSFNRLVSLNEVGGDPDKFGISVAAFHQQNLDRHQHWPHAMLTLSTHDTKRSEDVRARLNVLSEIPTEWQRRLSRWSRVNARKKRDLDGDAAPCRNDEYLLYQTLVGTWPLEQMDQQGRIEYQERITQYMLKAVHEAKVHTSWVNPNVSYEEALKSFIADLLTDGPKNAFLVDFLPFVQQVSMCGIWNSLSQTLLKFTCPGIPDTYQGTEILDFSLVDPDNRRPVDYEKRSQMLDTIHSLLHQKDEVSLETLREWMEHPQDGRLKMFVSELSLSQRRDLRPLFSDGEYVPLEVTGLQQENVCAFARQIDNEAVIVVVPRLVSQLTDFSGQPPIGEDMWQGTNIALPNYFAGSQFRNLFTDEIVNVESNGSRGELKMKDVLNVFPVALLRHVTQL